MEKGERLDKRDLGNILIIAALVILFFAQVLFTDRSFVVRDYYRYFYPTRHYAWESIRDGIVPLWNPYLYCGIPFLADLQSCIFYPPSIILYLLPFHYGLKFFCVFHFFLAGLFMYLLLRDFKMRRSASLVGAITFTFSGYLLSVVDMLTSLTSATWIPLIFLFFNRALNSDSNLKQPLAFRYAIFTGITLGVQFLGGEPTVLYTTLIALFFFALAKGIAWDIHRGGWSLKSRDLVTSCLPLLTPCFLLSAACVIALGLVLFQALPFLEMISHSTRAGGVSYETGTYWSLAPWEAILGLIAFLDWRRSTLFFTSQGWLKSVYIGIIPLVLCLYVILYHRRKITLFFFLLLLCFTFLSFGSNIPGYRFLYNHLPFLSFMCYPVKFFSMATFSLAVLSGFGFEHLLKGDRERKRAFGIFFGFNILFLFCSVINSIDNFRFLFSILRMIGIEIMRIDPIWIYCFSKTLTENLEMVTLFLALISLVLFLGRKKILLLSIGVIIMDIFYFGRDLNPLIGSEVYASPPKVVEIIKGEKGSHRFMLAPMSEEFYKYLPVYILEEGLDISKNLLLQNLGIRYHISYIGGAASIELKEYMELLKRLRHTPFKEVHSVLRLANVRYLSSLWRIEEEGVRLVYEDQSVKVYENPGSLPRAFILSQTVVIKEREEGFLNGSSLQTSIPQRRSSWKKNPLACRLLGMIHRLRLRLLNMNLTR